ncbi:Isoquinoline 1-oxidoreductase subunit [Marinivivus vitaminiproducens]|uniref:Isoquinoline 1-oxidoreductase subunit n=1 Tax=Marinivivus vitaminiproducens TaxID=3035935 RepID=UPI00279D0231|nr:hypothetical protein P4R82_14810 [Geminicoccaceae bacterium SCSIO 64248]
MIRHVGWTAAVLCAGLGAGVVLSETAVRAQDSGGDLQPLSAFEGIADPNERSVALFEEAGKVLTHPRCVNCHPAGDRPLQGEDGHLHFPAVQRGDGGIGVAGLRCGTCHQQANYDAVGIPGHPAWHLAPIEMAWEGKSLAEICGQIKDPERNGGMDMAELVEHMTHDTLVGWGWTPGKGREPAPGSQEAFGQLIAAWVDAGAHCPAS